MSLLAIIGLGLGLLSVSLYLFSAVWLITLPLAGIIVSSVALYRVKNSDNALAGANVARAGLAFSLVCGLSWTTMQITTNMIIQAEATTFVHKWLECMRDGKEGLAFICTVRPGSRPPELRAEDLDLRNIRAKYPAEQGAAFDTFRAVPLIELLIRGGKDITWQHQGIPDWYYFEGGWYVRHRLHLETPEAEADVVVLTISYQESRPTGPRREWRVDLNTVNLSPENTKSKPYGVEVSKARQEAFRALNHWVSLIGFAKKEEAAKFLASKDLIPELDSLYPGMRQGGASPNQPIFLKGKPPLVLQAEKDGTRWTLTIRATVEAGQFEVDFQTTWQNDDPNGDLNRWRITKLQYLGDRKRMDPDAMSRPQVPPKPM